jgi:hypothetical protein
MKTMFLAISILAAASASLAKGLCTGERDCPSTPMVQKAMGDWKDCVYESMATQMKHTDDPNIAGEAALAACTAEEGALGVMLQSESHLGPNEAESAKAFLRSRVKHDMLNLIRQKASP